MRLTRRRAAGMAVLALLVLAPALLPWARGGSALSWAAVGVRLAGWRAEVAAAPVLSGLVYVAAYGALVALSVPAGGLMSVLGGALFGALAGGALAVLAASLGAVLLFLLARGTLGRILARRAGPLVERFRPALARDGFAAMLAMRLLPVVPFWLGNLAPALLGARLLPYAAATVLGIAPATCVLAAVGAAARAVLARGQAPDLSVLRSAPVLLALLGLSALSLAPAAWRGWRGWRA
jgi:uncharacterized membrane protein YdjX (TVP38/TMEM64 family)